VARALEEKLELIERRFRILQSTMQALTADVAEARELAKSLREDKCHASIP
jgi:prefoldin subunit 5